MLRTTTVFLLTAAFGASQAQAECINNYDCFPNEHCLAGQCTDRNDRSERCVIDFDCGGGRNECVAGRCEIRRSSGGGGGNSGGGGSGGGGFDPWVDRGRTGNARGLAPNGQSCFMGRQRDSNRDGYVCVVGRDGDTFALDFFRRSVCQVSTMLHLFESTLASTCEGKWSLASLRDNPRDSDEDGVHDFADFCRDTPAGERAWQHGEWSGCSGGQQRDAGWRQRVVD